MKAIRISAVLLACATALSAQVRVQGEAPKDTVKKAAPAPAGVTKSPKMASNDRCIPVGKDGCRKVDTVRVERPGKPDTTVIVVRNEPARVVVDLENGRTAAPEAGCGNFISCHKVVSTVVGVVLGTGATMAIIACAKGKGMCGGNEQKTNVDVSVNVGHNRVGLGARVPIGILRP